MAPSTDQEEDVDTTPRPPTLLYTVKQLELAIRARLDRLLREHELTTTQYTALTVLERRPRMTSAELARASFVRAQSVQDLVTALEARRLVARTTDPAHARRLLIELTPAGREVLSRCAPAVEALEEQMVSGIDPEDRSRLRSELARCRSALAD